jgi:hypothetical protein
MTTPRKQWTRASRQAELALSVPQVVGHRLARMALAGPVPSARDSREFHRMGAEKVAAFTEAWLAMGAAAWQANAMLSMSMWRAAWTPWTAGPASSRMLGRWQGAMLGAFDKGVAPVHRTATANARRLSRGARRRPAP